MLISCQYPSLSRYMTQTLICRKPHPQPHQGFCSLSYGCIHGFAGSPQVPRLSGNSVPLFTPACDRHTRLQSSQMTSRPGRALSTRVNKKRYLGWQEKGPGWATGAEQGDINLKVHVPSIISPPFIHAHRYTCTLTCRRAHLHRLTFTYKHILALQPQAPPHRQENGTGSGSLRVPFGFYFKQLGLTDVLLQT